MSPTDRFKMLCVEPGTHPKFYGSGSEKLFDNQQILLGCMSRGVLLVLGRVLKVGGAESPKIYSNYAMTGKELPCLGIACDSSVAHVHHGVLDIGVA